MSEDQESDDALQRLSDPLDDVQFNGVTLGETWRVQAGVKDFLQRYAQLIGLDEVALRYTIGDRIGTRSFYLQLDDRCLFTRDVVVGIQTEVLAGWPEWTVILAGESREEAALISSHSITTDSRNVDDIALFMQQFADEEMAYLERRYGPLNRQKQYVETQLMRGVSTTQEQPFQVVAICEHWRKPDKYLGVWVIGESDIDEVYISVPDEEVASEEQFAVSPTGKLLDYRAPSGKGTSRRESKYWVSQWLIPRHYQGQYLIAKRDSDTRQWQIPFDQSSIRMNSDL